MLVVQLLFAKKKYFIENENFDSLPLFLYNFQLCLYLES